MDKKRFVITGGNFKNKGAQAMTFVTVSELRRVFPNCEIYMLSDVTESADMKAAMKFEVLNNRFMGWKYARGGFETYTVIVRIAFSRLKGNNIDFKSIIDFKKVIKKADAIIDISGYALSSQWGYEATISYLNTIKTAKKLNIPMYIMPQSFGPFNYGEQQDKVEKMIKRYMQYPQIIYAREKYGYDELVEHFGLKNVKQAQDIVLQNKEINKTDVFVKDINNKKIILKTSKNVAIIPNMRNFDHGNRELIVELYIKVIRKLQGEGRSIYLIRHSFEDIEACRIIYSSLTEKENVYLQEDDINCLEYEDLIKQFDFIIASRYHSIVHAYKMGVPAIILGWAEKYHSLAKIFKQQQFVFDVRENIDIEKMISDVNIMSLNYMEEKYVIQKELKNVQKDNCFDYVYAHMRNW